MGAEFLQHTGVSAIITALCLRRDNFQILCPCLPLSSAEAWLSGCGQEEEEEESCLLFVCVSTTTTTTTNLSADDVGDMSCTI